MKLYLLLLFFTFSLCTHAQVTDTLTKEHFKEYKFSKIKTIFKNDSQALRIIKSYRTYRTLSNIAIPWGIIATVNDPGMGAVLISAGVAGHLLHTKNRLYDALVKSEELKYQKKWRDTVKVEPPKFNLTYSQFKKLSRWEIRNCFMYNDTTKYIMDYSFHYMTVRNVGKTMMFFIPTGVILIASSVAFRNYDAALAPFIGGVECLIIGAAGVPIYLCGDKHSSKRVLYKRLFNYYKYGIIDDDVKQYIKNKH